MENIKSQSTAEKARLFVAVKLSKKVKEELSRLQKILDTCHCISGTYPKQEAMHLTLKFIGSVSPDKFIAIKNALKTVKMPVIRAQLAGIICFDSLQAPKVICIVVDSPAVEELALGVENSLINIVKQEQRIFKAHVTLVRVKRVLDTGKLLDCLKKIQVHPLSFSIKHFTLYQSELNADGPLHTSIEHYDLTL